MGFLNLKYPILQAPIGSAAAVELAAAVSNAGGIGSLALMWTEPDAAVHLVREVRAATTNSFFVNFVLSLPPQALEAVLEAGVPAVTFSWSRATQFVKQVHHAKALVGVQIGTVEGEKQARDDGADFVICQSVEPGGHVQSTTPLSELMSDVVEMAGSI